MDRRQQKTRESIFRAFSKLLETKNFNHITVQQIIDEANIGRSTFYAHFETKDELLKAMCTDMFRHVFSDELTQEKSHDFSSDNTGLEAKLTHILYHLKDSKSDITGILSCESGELFMKYFKEFLMELFARYLSGQNSKIPTPFLLHQLAAGFAEAAKWWINDNMKYSPEEMAGYYMAVININCIE